MAGISPDELDRAERVLDTVRDAWLGRSGVTAVDLGFKWVGGKMTDQLAIRVHVSRKKKAGELSPDEFFPKDVEGIPVDIIQATYAPQMVIHSRPETAVGGRDRRYDIVPIGVSIGCKYSTAGTLGAKVFDLDSGEAMILSNWHVLVGRTDAETGMAIWQPGWIDGGTRQENTIAELTRWILGPFDAAVARLTGAREVQTKTLEGRVVEDLTNPRLGMSVWKSGRSTGRTEGFIDGMKMTIPLLYPTAGTRILEQVFRIVPKPGSMAVELSIGGDSGAVWVDEDSGKAVGLHFAGELGDSPEHALAHDIGPVLNRLSVRLPNQRASTSAGATSGSGTGPSPPPDEPPIIDHSLWSSISSYLRKIFGSDSSQ